MHQDVIILVLWIALQVSSLKQGTHLKCPISCLNLLPAAVILQDKINSPEMRSLL